MIIKNMYLKDFRNIKTEEINFNENINIIYGNNAQGKTNILEAIYAASVGRSHRTKYEREMIEFSKKDCHIRADVNDSLKIRIDLHLKRDGRKGIAINGVTAKTTGELIGIFDCVMFSPEDLYLIKSGPSERRRFIDIELCRINRVYFSKLKMYSKVLRQRNNLLKKISKDKSLKETVFVWDRQLIEYGEFIIKARKEFIEEIEKYSEIYHSKITGGKEKLKLKYKPSVSAENLAYLIEKNIDRDIIYGSTLFGPHKDDLLFFINGADVKNYGSQGQQRSAALSLKLAEIELIKKHKQKEPVLLLDDVFSELDDTRQKFLIDNINDIQMIAACTGVEELIKKIHSKTSIKYVENGCISDYNFL